MIKDSWIIVSGQILMAAAIIGSTLIIAGAFKQVKFGQGTIHVKGCAEREIRSDFVKWHGTITASATTQIQAYETLEKDLETLQAYMQGEGIPKNALSLSPIYSNTIFQINDKGFTTNAIDHYVLNQDFSIATSDISLIEKVSQNITSLLKDGLSLNSFSPEYFYLKIDELKIAMLGEAAKDAKQRAEQLVSQSNSLVGPLRSAQQGVFQITPAFSNSVSDYGEYDTSSVDKRIKAVVTMEYAID